MKYTWVDLPERKNCFTVRNAVMINLNDGKIVRHYSANTKIAVVQKCVTSDCTYYRTAEAAHHYLNYAFKASAFGLPNEVAPSEPSLSPKKDNSTLLSPKKYKREKKASSSKDGESKGHMGWVKKFLRRANGKAKNS